MIYELNLPSDLQFSDQNTVLKDIKHIIIDIVNSEIFTQAQKRWFNFNSAG